MSKKIIKKYNTYIHHPDKSKFQSFALLLYS